MTDPGADFLRRLDAVEARLQAQAGTEMAPDALTAPDPPTGERWEAGQVWAHVAEFVPYWQGEAEQVVEHGRREPVAFGRTKSDPARLAAIERDRDRDPRLLWNRIAGDIAGLRAFLRGLETPAWTGRGLHPSLGEMDLRGLVDEFLVGHLEQHADQLDGLVTT
ncbi:MAG: hypothetical protein ABI352_07845 [Candidatus Dormibacter sp.]